MEVGPGLSLTSLGWTTWIWTGLMGLEVGLSFHCSLRPLHRGSCSVLEAPAQSESERSNWCEDGGVDVDIGLLFVSLSVKR